MSNYSKEVYQAICRFEKNEIIVASQLYKSELFAMPEQTFYKNLERLCQSGELVHLTKGLYYRPKASRFGNVPISEAEIIQFYLKNEEGVLVGYRLFNQKGLTTQIGKNVTILSNTIAEEKKNVQNVCVKKINVPLNKETIPVIEMLEVLQAYYKIEDINNHALAAYMKKFSEAYSDAAANEVLENVKYKKSTIAFLRALLEYLNIPNTLNRHLSSLSNYRIPSVEAIYEAAS